MSFDMYIFNTKVATHRIYLILISNFNLTIKHIKINRAFCQWRDKFFKPIHNFHAFFCVARKPFVSYNVVSLQYIIFFTKSLFPKTIKLFNKRRKKKVWSNFFNY